MRSHCLLETNDQDWMHWIEHNPAANIFHHPAWAELLSTCYGYRPFVLAIRNSTGHITAGIPLMELKHFGQGKRWAALPFTDHCSPLSEDPDSLMELVKGLSEQYRQGSSKELLVRWNLPALPAAQFSSRHVLHLIELEADSQRVKSRLHSSHRRNIKHAQKNEVRVEQGNSEEHLREFFHLHLITRRRQGMPTQPWHFFQLLEEILLKKNLGFIVLAYKESTCVAASVFLKWQKTLTYKYGASLPDTDHLRANNLVMWTAIRWGCENGYTVFDLGRTDNENIGLRRYKSGWGALETPLSYSILSQKRIDNSANHLMHLMQKFIQVSPLWVSQFTGNLLYRYFG